MPRVVKSEAFSYICVVMDNWKNIAHKDIVAHGVCDEYSSLLSRAKTMDEAIALYKRGIDWCLEENSPSIAILRDYKDACETNGVFIDRQFHGEMLTDEQVYVFHNCRGTIRVGLNKKKRIIPMLCFANGCSMDVKGLPGSGLQTRVPLYIFGSNRISAEQSEDIECKIYKFETK